MKPDFPKWINWPFKSLSRDRYMVQNYSIHAQNTTGYWVIDEKQLWLDPMLDWFILSTIHNFKYSKKDCNRLDCTKNSNFVWYGNILNPALLRTSVHTLIQTIMTFQATNAGKTQNLDGLLAEQGSSGSALLHKHGNNGTQFRQFKPGLNVYLFRTL